MTKDKLVLRPRRWYGWQTIPGEHPESALRPSTPAFLTEVTPLKTGKSVLGIGFVAALRSGAAERRTVDLRVVFHRDDHLIGTFLDAAGRERTAIVREIDLPWLAHYATEFWSRFPSSRFEWHGTGISAEGYDAQAKSPQYVSRCDTPAPSLLPVTPRLPTFKSSATTRNFDNLRRFSIRKFCSVHALTAGDVITYSSPSDIRP